MARTKQTTRKKLGHRAQPESENNPVLKKPYKRKKISHFKNEKVELTLPKEIWNSVIDFLSHVDYPALQQVCQQMKQITDPILKGIKTFTNTRAQCIEVEKSLYFQNEDSGEWTFNEKELDNKDNWNFVENGDDYDDACEEGTFLVEEVYLPGSSRLLQPLATKLQRYASDGDVVALKGDDYYGYRNCGKYIYNDGKIYELDTRTSDNNGTCPALFPIEKFCLQHFLQVIDHNATRMFKINPDKLIKVQEDGRDVAYYNVRYNHVDVPFNIRYKFFLSADQNIKNGWVMGKPVSAFVLN
ncbi:PCMP-E24 [Acrasis kona]|uniref:PCMP-E24 n=1 Tax=Acrasis kona TaxID=1008807 RepID=A0AAW2ZD97_9EUKA